MGRSIATTLYCFMMVFARFSRVSANAEGDALNALKNNVADPHNIIQTWDPTLVTPCTWFHVACDIESRVIRVDLGNSNLSGQLVPQLGQLQHLQYLELYGNNLSGRIPNEIGNLTNLVSMDLYLNSLSGPIPDALSRLQKLRFLRLNSNSLSGEIPVSLTTILTLQVLDLSSNRLTGRIPVNGSFQFFTPISFDNNKLEALPISLSPPLPPTSSPPHGLATLCASSSITFPLALSRIKQ